MGLFAALTTQERHTLANMLLSGSRELIAEKLQLRRTGNEQARALYGVVADDYVGAIDDVHGVLNDLLTVPVAPHDEGTSYCTGIPGDCPLHPEPVLVPTGTGWPVA